MGRVPRFVLLPSCRTSLIATRRSKTSSKIGATKLKLTPVLVSFLRTDSVARVASHLLLFYSPCFYILERNKNFRLENECVAFICA